MLFGTFSITGQAKCKGTCGHTQQLEGFEVTAKPDASSTFYGFVIKSSKKRRRYLTKLNLALLWLTWKQSAIKYFLLKAGEQVSPFPQETFKLYVEEEQRPPEYPESKALGIACHCC